MGIFKNKRTRTLILYMGVLSVIAILFYRSYYKKQNSSVDPRIAHARLLYENYNRYALNNQIDSVLWLMDTIENVYTSIPYYSDSYEIGVLYNNRSALYLTLAIHSVIAQSDSIYKDSLLNLAHSATTNSIQNYKNWLATNTDSVAEKIKNNIKTDFLAGLDQYTPEQQAKYLKNRIKEILDARIETPRRLSVSVTNLGIIYRHREDYEKAARCYAEALELWEQNLTAENNLNIIMGRPLKKRNLIQKMFPPERK